LRFAIHRQLVDGMRHAGLNVVRAVDVLPAGTLDFQHLAYTARQNMVIVSHDASTMPAAFWAFLEISEHPGLIIIAQKYSQQVGDIVEWIESQAASTLRNNVRYYPQRS